MRGCEDVTLSSPPAGPVLAHLADNAQQQRHLDCLRYTLAVVNAGFGFMINTVNVLSFESVTFPNSFFFFYPFHFRLGKVLQIFLIFWWSLNIINESLQVFCVHGWQYRKQIIPFLKSDHKSDQTAASDIHMQTSIHPAIVYTHFFLFRVTGVNVLC